MNKELMDALNILEKEREISKESLFAAIENSLLTACKNHYRSAEEVRVEIDKETGEIHVFVTKDVVETEEDVRMDPSSFIILEDALLLDPNAEIGGYVEVEVDSKEFGRIATQNAKNVITQKIREEERNVVYNQFHEKEHDIITGILQRRSGKDWNINLGRTDAILPAKEMIETENYVSGSRMKFYILEVKSTPKGSKITVSRTHPDLVKRLFEEEVTEIQDGTVEIMSIAREAGRRAKMAVYSNNPNVDPVGACVGVNGVRVNAIVNELRGEKIDIINWDDNPGNMIRNALSPAQIVNVFADPEEMTANVVVPDNQLSLAIGKEGQNARLAAKLTGYKIDIKSETQAKDAYGFRIEDYMGDDGYDMIDEEGYDEEYVDENTEEGINGNTSADESTNNDEE